MGLNPGTIYWMDIFSHIFDVCLKRPKINNERGRRNRAVVVVKWSACLSSTLTVRVQIPVKSTVFSVKFVFEKNKNKQKRGRGRPIFLKIKKWGHNGGGVITSNDNRMTELGDFRKLATHFHAKVT